MAGNDIYEEGVSVHTWDKLTGATLQDGRSTARYWKLCPLVSKSKRNVFWLIRMFCVSTFLHALLKTKDVFLSDAFWIWYFLLLARIYKSATNSSLQVPNEVVTYFVDHVHEWSFDIFHFEKLTSSQPLRYATYELCQKCELPKRHEVWWMSRWLFCCMYI